MGLDYGDLIEDLDCNSGIVELELRDWYLDLNDPNFEINYKILGFNCLINLD
jgi:hypothetical protein